MLQAQSIFILISLNILLFSSGLFSAQATLENTLQAIPAQPRVLSCLDLRPESWQLLLEHPDLKPWGQSEAIQAQLQDWQKASGIDLLRELMPVLGTHLCMAYDVPEGEKMDWGTGASERGKHNYVKANMYSLQNLLENYAYDHLGDYPSNLKLLQHEAQRQQYWKELSNPYTQQVGIGSQAAFMDYSELDLGIHLAGQVAYIPLIEPGSKKVRTYIIVGFDQQGELLETFHRETQSSKLYYLSSSENTVDLFASDQNSYESQLKAIIEKLQLYPTLRLKEKRPDSILLSVDLQSEVTAQYLLSKMVKHLQAQYISSIKEFEYRGVQGIEIIFDAEIKPLAFFQSPTSEQQSQSLYLGVTGKHLLISLAGDPVIWKQSVDAALEPAVETQKQSILAPILTELSPRKFWIYADQDLITGFVNETFHRFEQPLYDALTQVQNNLFAGTALAFDWQINGFDIYHHHLYATALNQEQTTRLKQLQQEQPLIELLSYSPEQALLFAQTHDFKQVFQAPHVYEMSTLALNQVLQPLQSNDFAENFQIFTHLNLEQDLLSQLKGPAALVAVDTGQDAIEPLPVSLILQAQDAPALLKKILTQFSLDPVQLNQQGWLPALDQKLIDHLQLLQKAVESFGDQTIQKGAVQPAIYPANIQALQRAQYRSDVDMSYVGAYQLEFTNPVTGSQELAQNLADFKTFQGQRTKENFKGMLLYQAVGKAYYDAKQQQTFYPSYRLWAYTHDGYLLELSKGQSIKSPKRLGERPLRWDPVSTEIYQGIPLYQWQKTDMLRHFKHQTSMDPVMAQLDDKILLSVSLDAIKQSIDSLQNRRRALSQSTHFQTALQELNPLPQNDFFYMDTQTWALLLQRVWSKEHPDPTESETKNISKMKNLLSAFKSISRSSAYSLASHNSHLHFAVNLAQLDFQTLGEIMFGSGINPEEGNRRALISSVKSNMHILQTILETHALESDGVYPDDIYQLYEAAEKGQYWKEFANPYTGLLGIGMRGSVMDFKDYQPSPEFAGRVLYEVAQRNQNGKAVEYKIYGCDTLGHLIKHQGEIFYLSPS